MQYLTCGKLKMQKEELMTIQEFLIHNILITDGAMGTYYASKDKKDNVISEKALLEEPDRIKEIHHEYIEAGASLIKTNTFLLNSQALGLDEKDCKKVQKIAIQLAKEAIEESKKTVYLAGDIGPIPENSNVEESDIIMEYKQIINGFLEEKVDAILFETFSDLRYLDNLSSYIKEKSPTTFVIATLCVNKNGYTSTGLSVKKMFAQFSKMPGMDACGLNCGIGSGHMYQVVEQAKLPTNKYVMIAPNAGYPEQFNSRMIFMDNANYFGENARKLVKLGVRILGACCGTTPKYIKKVVENVNDEIKAIALPALTVRDLNIDESETPLGLDDMKDENLFLKKLMSGEKVVAVELDPPYDAVDMNFLASGKKLSELSVDIITIADSPRGRSRIDSMMMSIKLSRVCHVEVMPHVCCRDRNMVAMRSALLGGYVNDIRNLLLVTGDPLPLESRAKTSNVFDYNSIRLMEFVKEMNEEHFAKDPIIYGGALNYSGVNVDKIIERMQRKLDAGAAYFLTQPIYSEEDMERIALLRDRTKAKILAGIMPFVSYTNANFVKNEFAGIHVPDEIVTRYHKEMSREEAELVGAQLATELASKLHPMCDGYYFMLPFNRVSIMASVNY
jgi:homocysteine S-methyltransferase